MRVLRKRPAEALLFDFDGSRQIYHGDTLAAIISTTATPSGLSFESGVINAGAVTWPDEYSAIAGQVAQMRISGGVAGTRYVIDVTCSTTLGDTVILRGVLDVIA